MGKQDVLRQIVARTGRNALTSRLVLDSFFDLVQSALTRGEPIHIHTFGSFVAKHRAAKTGRNINQNITVPIAAHVIPYFKPSRELSDRVRARAIPLEPKKLEKR